MTPSSRRQLSCQAWAAAASARALISESVHRRVTVRKMKRTSEGLFQRDMKRLNAVVHWTEGLHLRHATSLARRTQKFCSTIVLSAEVGRPMFEHCERDRTVRRDGNCA